MSTMTSSTTKICLTNSSGEYSITVNDSEMTLDDMFMFLIKPILNAAGYSSKLVDDYIGC